MADRTASDQSKRTAARCRPSSRIGSTLESIANADAAIAPVYDMADVTADEHVRERRILTEVDDVLMQGPIVGLSLTPGHIRWAGPPVADGEGEMLGDSQSNP